MLVLQGKENKVHEKGKVNAITTELHLKEHNVDTDFKKDFYGEFICSKNTLKIPAFSPAISPRVLPVNKMQQDEINITV